MYVTVVFFMRAYAIAPTDRMTTLSLGIALLHAAMQRKSDNRHLQIMQVKKYACELQSTFFLNRYMFL